MKLWASHSQPLTIVEVVLVDPKAAILPQVNEVLEDLLAIDRPAIRVPDP